MEVLTAFLTVLRIAELWSGREKSIHARNYAWVLYNNNAKNSRRMPSFKWERRSLGPTKGDARNRGPRTLDVKMGVHFRLGKNLR
jgi:hypothetical protein